MVLLKQKSAFQRGSKRNGHGKYYNFFPSSDMYNSCTHNQAGKENTVNNITLIQSNLYANISVKFSHIFSVNC
jgi:hypothetical protein